MNWQKQSCETRKKLKGEISKTLEIRYGYPLDTIKGVLKQCFNVDYTSPSLVDEEITRIGTTEFSRAVNRYLRRQKNKEYYEVI